jgi:hypothetical protein
MSAELDYIEEIAPVTAAQWRMLARPESKRDPRLVSLRLPPFRRPTPDCPACCGRGEFLAVIRNDGKFEPGPGPWIVLCPCTNPEATP